MKHFHAKVFLLFNTALHAVLFIYHQQYTITWGWEMPASFTSQQIVAELWSVEGALGILISLGLYELVKIAEEK